MAFSDQLQHVFHAGKLSMVETFSSANQNVFQRSINWKNFRRDTRESNTRFPFRLSKTVVKQPRLLRNLLQPIVIAIQIWLEITSSFPRKLLKRRGRFLWEIHCQYRKTFSGQHDEHALLFSFEFVSLFKNYGYLFLLILSHLLALMEIEQIIN